MEHTIIMVESIDQDSDSDANTSCGTVENKIPAKKFKKNTSKGNVVLRFSQSNRIKFLIFVIFALIFPLSPNT